MEENTEQKGNMTPLFIGVAVLVVLAGGFFLFKSNNTSNQMTEDTTTEKSVVEEESVVEETSDEAMMEDEETIMDEDVVEVDVEGGSFYFEPSELIVKKGQGHFSTGKNPEYTKFPFLLELLETELIRDRH